MRDKDLRKNYHEYFFGRKNKIHKSSQQVKRETKLIRNYWKCPPYHYFRYKLYNKILTDDQLLEYVPAYYFYIHYMSDVYKDLDLSIIEDKIKAHWLFKNNGIPTPVLMGYTRHNLLFDSQNKNIAIDQLIKSMENSGSDKFFFKPSAGKGGSGIFIVSKINGRLTHTFKGDLAKSLQSILGNGDYLIQEGLIQRPDISYLNPSSVNTLRVVTQIVNETPRIAIAVIRIGRNSMFLDNSSKGGISAEINRETGHLNRYAYTEHNMRVFEHHPDSGIIFENFKIKDWDVICNKICSYAVKLKFFRELAWDIAIGMDDVVVIEVNSYYGIDHLQCCTGGVAGKLNIRKVLN